MLLNDNCMYGCYVKATECYPKKQKKFSSHLLFLLKSSIARNLDEIGY